jgi:hypothetical protein
MSTICDTLCHAYAFVLEGYSRHLRDRHAVGMCTTLPRTNWIIEECTHVVYQRTWMITKLVIWESNAFYTFCLLRRALSAVQSYKAWNKSIMWHMTPKKKKPWCGNTHHLCGNFKPMPSVRKIMTMSPQDRYPNGVSR